MSPKQTFINDALRASAAAAARSRSEAIAQKVRDTMRQIDEEMAGNDGLYPAGNLNQRELCRRAGVHYQTLHQPIHKESLKLAVDNWLASKKIKTIRDTHKAVTDLADHWKEQHLKVTTQICIYEAELAERNTRIAELEELVARLQEQNALLQVPKVRRLSSICSDDKK